MVVRAGNLQFLKKNFPKHHLHTLYFDISSNFHCQFIIVKYGLQTESSQLNCNLQFCSGHVYQEIKIKMPKYFFNEEIIYLNSLSIKNP